jgi:hypothetical protein
MPGKCCTELHHSQAITFDNKYKHNCPYYKNSSNTLHMDNKDATSLTYSCFLLLVFKIFLLLVGSGVGTSLLARQASYH